METELAIPKFNYICKILSREMGHIFFKQGLYNSEKLAASNTRADTGYLRSDLGNPHHGSVMARNITDFANFAVLQPKTT